VANGTSTTYKYVGWIDKEKQQQFDRLIQQNSTQPGGTILDIDMPDFIVVQIKVPKPSLWATADLLVQQSTTSSNDEVPGFIEIPIGIRSERGDKSKIKIETTSTVEFKRHAVDLAFALTAWKAQGASLDYIILNLTPLPGSPKLNFHLLYVFLSRATSGKRLRCLPNNINQEELLLMKPKFNAVRYLLDIDENGYWFDRTQN